MPSKRTGPYERAVAATPISRRRPGILLTSDHIPSLPRTGAQPPDRRRRPRRGAAVRPASPRVDLSSLAQLL